MKVSGWLIMFCIVIPGLALTVLLGQWNLAFANGWPVWPFQVLGLVVGAWLVTALSVRVLRR